MLLRMALFFLNYPVRISQKSCRATLDKAKRYTDITELTPELLRLFIEKIVVHEKEVKWSKHAPQTVEIYYNGIGFVDSQQQDMESLQPRKTEEPRQAS